MSMKYWLCKSEPYKYSWDDLVRDKVEHWDGIRNYVARNNLAEMKVGDQIFFYHSNEGKDIVGIAEVVKEAYPDHTFTPKPNAKGELKNPWLMPDIKPVRKLKNPVTLAQVKADPRLQDMSLVTSMRLSVQPVTPEEWQIVLELAGE